jgi:hypothetical protein
MVRFSDLLGGNEDPEAKPAVPPSPDASLLDHSTADKSTADKSTADEVADDEVDEDKSPEDVLERLTQYATSSRGADDAPEPPQPPEPSAGQESDPSSFTPVGDDLLPRPKGRKGR